VPIILSVLSMIFQERSGVFYEAQVKGFHHLQAVEDTGGKLDWKKSEVFEIQQWVRV
jgi:hypothetical protein